MRIVLDASALMAFLEARAGAEKLEEIIRLGVTGKRELLMSAVNWGEVYYSAWREHGERAARKTLAEIAQLPIEIVDADLELTRSAAEIHTQHRLPYADSFAAALASTTGAAVATSDRDFTRVGDLVELIWIS